MPLRHKHNRYKAHKTVSNPKKPPSGHAVLKNRQNRGETRVEESKRGGAGEEKGREEIRTPHDVAARESED